MAFRDHDEAAPTAGILDVIVWRRYNDWLHKRPHPKRVANFGERGKNCFFAIKAVRISAVTVDGDVLAEMS